MASIRERHRTDGSIYYSVLWRILGKQTSISVDDLRDAEHIKAYLDLSGGRLPSVLEHPDDALTVTQLVTRHIDALSGVQPHTIKDYRAILTNHITPRLGRLDAASVTREQVSRWVNGLSVAPKTIRNVHALLSNAYAFGVEHELVTRNPAKGVRMPAPRRTRDAVLIPHDEYELIIASLPEAWRPFFILLGSTGMRWAEAAALTVGDINRRAGTVTISKAVKRNPGEGPYIGSAKTRRSHRVISLPAAALDALRPLLLRPRAERLFPSPTGALAMSHRYTADAWRSGIAAAREQYGQGVITADPVIHDFRHSHASWLLAAGVSPKVVQERLGHETVDVTMQIYTHVHRDADAAAAARFDELGRQAEPARIPSIDRDDAVAP